MLIHLKVLEVKNKFSIFFILCNVKNRGHSHKHKFYLNSIVSYCFFLFVLLSVWCFVIFSV